MIILDRIKDFEFSGIIIGRLRIKNKAPEELKQKTCDHDIILKMITG